ncbi:TetR/AcrR family transcriptional regulator [Cryptosporangium sp. NPDC048952]|uniref:TetR/AcrR family transcriptional regulator n=1 Tax=Cryptosporangium sp. NPDC048952 TaxID=3363961 RepID=UPI003710B437
MGTDNQERVIVRRGGDHTRRQAQRVALELFTKQGYEATSLRQIAEELGITKSSLYYHFPSKEAILRSLFSDRATEAEALVAWVREQPRSPRLLETAVLRWVESLSTDKLHGIRFMAANPLIARTMEGAEEDSVGSNLTALADELVALLPSPTPADTLLVRMSILSINAAVAAAADTDIADDEIVGAATTAARTLIRLVTSGADPSPLDRPEN